MPVEIFSIPSNAEKSNTAIEPMIACLLGLYQNKNLQRLPKGLSRNGGEIPKKFLGEYFD
jgi:hypothetical protein